MYKLRKLRAADGRSQVLEAITCPSGLDVTDSDREEAEEDKDENNNEGSQQSSSSATVGTGVQDVSSGSGSGDEESDQVRLLFVCCKFVKIKKQTIFPTGTSCTSAEAQPPLGEGHGAAVTSERQTI